MKGFCPPTPWAGIRQRIQRAFFGECTPQAAPDPPIRAHSYNVGVLHPHVIAAHTRRPFEQ